MRKTYSHIFLDLYRLAEPIVLKIVELLLQPNFDDDLFGSTMFSACCDMLKTLKDCSHVSDDEYERHLKIPLLRTYNAWITTLKLIDFDENMPDIVETHIGGLFTDYISCIAARILEKDHAARVIQRNLHNWLYSPTCKDGTTGIAVRLGWRSIAEPVS